MEQRSNAPTFLSWALSMSGWFSDACLFLKLEPLHLITKQEARLFNANRLVAWSFCLYLLCGR